MKVIDHINNAKDTIFSFEILPPLKGQNIKEIYGTIDALMDFKPPFVNVTYHREEVVYKRHDSGLLEQKTILMRYRIFCVAGLPRRIRRMHSLIWISLE